MSCMGNKDALILHTVHIVVLSFFVIYTMSQKMSPNCYILINSAKNELFLIIFGTQNPEKISHQKIVKSPTYIE